MQVTAGSSVDDEQENRFTPDTVWVKIIRLEDGALWKGRTASKLLRQSVRTALVVAVVVAVVVIFVVVIVMIVVIAILIIIIIVPVPPPNSCSL